MSWSKRSKPVMKETKLTKLVNQLTGLYPKCNCAEILQLIMLKEKYLRISDNVPVELSRRQRMQAHHLKIRSECCRKCGHSNCVDSSFIALIHRSWLKPKVIYKSPLTRVQLYWSQIYKSYNLPRMNWQLEREGRLSQLSTGAPRWPSAWGTHFHPRIQAAAASSTCKTLYI